jgi:4-hydroxy-2-oxoheptanedioate aldolase
MLLDLEHNPIDTQQASINLSVISDVSQGRVTPIARVIAGTVHHIKRALDCGAQGVLVPMINSKKEAEDVVRFSRYPPVGDRGAGGLDPHLGFGVNRPSYIAQANNHIIVAIQIETKESVENIEEITSVEGLDVIFIGPNDLHLSLGLPAKFWSEEKVFLDNIEKIKTASKKKNLPLGIICRDHKSAQERIKEGFQFIALGSDCHFMLTFAGMECGGLKQSPEPEETWCNLVQIQPKL